MLTTLKLRMVMVSLFITITSMNPSSILLRYGAVGDYNCAYDVEIDELQQRLEPARKLIEDIEKLVNKK